MPRPPLPVGTYGAISYFGERPKIRAKTRFRDLDGTTRVVTRWGGSKAAARDALVTALRDRAGPIGSGITGETRLELVAREWMREVDESERAESTKALFRRVAESRVIPGVGQLCVREATVPVIDRAIRVVRDEHGPGAARTYRQVLSGVLGVAVRHGAIRSNPVREAMATGGKRRQPVRALTADEAATLTAALTQDPAAVAYDLPALCTFLLGTGARIGETLALRWPAVDLSAGTVEIAATISDAKGMGSFIQEWTKTDAGHRVLALPASLSQMLAGRLDIEYPENDQALVFPNPLGKLRNRGRTVTRLRHAFDRIGPHDDDGAGPFSWVTSHTFRKSVATRLDEAGLSARQIADQLGHARPSLTTDVYMGRRVVSSEAAAVLDLGQSGS